MKESTRIRTGKFRYAVHPGPIRSEHDGQIHHISFLKLCRLYDVKPRLCLDMSRPELRQGLSTLDLIHLHPRTNGAYPPIHLTCSSKCPHDTDGDGDCHRCIGKPEGCDLSSAGDLHIPRSAALQLIEIENKFAERAAIARATAAKARAAGNKVKHSKFCAVARAWEMASKRLLDLTCPF